MSDSDRNSNILINDTWGKSALGRWSGECGKGLSEDQRVQMPGGRLMECAAHVSAMVSQHACTLDPGLAGVDPVPLCGLLQDSQQ